MKTISKHFETINQAVNFRAKLYEKYDVVNMTDSPLFEESGIYTFSVE